MSENHAVNDQQPGSERPEDQRPQGEPTDVEHTLRLPGEQRPTQPAQPGQQQAPQGYPAYGQYASQGQHPQQGQYPQPGQHVQQGYGQYGQQQGGPQHGQHAQQQGPPSYVPSGPASYAPTQQGRGYASGPQSYAGYGSTGTTYAQPKQKEKRRGLWPVAILALVVGLIGGAVGGAAVDQWQEATQDPGRTSGGLADVDTVAKAPLPADNGSIAAVAKKTLPSTVQIIATSGGDEAAGATGSGFFLDRQGHVVTNNHVVAEAADNGKIEVIDQDGKRYPATVVGRSPIYDLAVLYLKDKPEDIAPASLGNSTNLQIGEGVVAIGSPLGLSSTVTSGIISALDRPVTTGGDAENVASYINAVQTDAAINPGNSGGPLVDMRGQVVGVNSAIATTGGSLGGESGNIGVGFAIPIEQVKVTADQILKDGEARYPVIGASVDSDGSGDGAHIQDVEKGSPAERAGLKKGDVVTALNDRAVTDSPSLIVAIRAHLPGEKVTLTVDRNGDAKKLEVTLDSKVG